MPFVAVVFLQSPVLPDTRLLFIVNVVVVLSVVVFATAVIIVLLRRSYHRRVEVEKLAAMGTATARILHQIKNPLQTIVLHADLLQQDSVARDTQARREVCEAIVGESQRLVVMLGELSAYASGSSRAFSRDPLALHDLMRHLAKRGAGEQTVRVDASEITEAVVLGDIYYLQQAFDNLIRNASEAMEGQPDACLSLSVERVGAQAMARVSDNGGGIPTDQLLTIFEPFVTTKGKGMGLGLSITREILEGHGGQIEVESAVGVGTTFTISLPLHTEEESARAGTSDEGRAWS